AGSRRVWLSAVPSAVESPRPAIPGALQGRDAVKALHGDLGRTLRRRGESTDVVEPILASDPTAYLTTRGVVFAASAPTVGTASAASDPRPSGPPVPDRLTAAGIPIHHSLPGSDNQLYLDFDGVPAYGLGITGLP